MPFYKKLFHKPIKYLAKQYRLSREAEEKVAKKFGGILPMPEVGGVFKPRIPSSQLSRFRVLADKARAGQLKLPEELKELKSLERIAKVPVKVRLSRVYHRILKGELKY